MTDEELQEMADIYGLYTEEDVKSRLRYETATFQRHIDILQGFLDRDTEFNELKNNLEKSKHMLEIFVEEVGKLPGCYRTMIVDDTVLEAKRFLNWEIH